LGILSYSLVVEVFEDYFFDGATLKDIVRAAISLDKKLAGAGV